MRQAVRRVALGLALGLASPLASAQNSLASPTTPCFFAARKAAFMALPEATRKATQQALAWLGLYIGVNDGEFGKGAPTTRSSRSRGASKGRRTARCRARF